MRLYVMKPLRVVVLLITLCVLASTQAGLAWADDSPPPNLPPSQPVLEPVTQWGVSAPSVSLPWAMPEQMPSSWANPSPAVLSLQWGFSAPSVRLPWAMPVQMPSSWANPSLAVAPLQWGSSALAVSLPWTMPVQMPSSWVNSSLAVAPLVNLPSLYSPSVGLQPVAQWDMLDWPVVQTTAPRLIDLDASAYQSPASVNIDLFVNSMVSAASADARWQSEEQLMTRDAMLTAQMYVDGAFLALQLDNPLAWIGYGVSRLNSEGLKTGWSGANMSGALLTQDWGSALRQAGHWSLDHTLLQTPSAQSLSGPFFGSRAYTVPIQDPYFQGYSQVSVQSMYQPVFSENPTGWFVFPDYYQETTITHVSTRVTYGSSATWTPNLHSFQPYYSPPIQQYYSPSFQPYYSPPVQQYYTPPFQQTYTPSFPQSSWPNW